MGSVSQRWFLWGVYSIVIAGLSLSPSKAFDGIPVFSFEDLIVHFTLYAIYTALLIWAWQPDHNKLKLHIFIIIAICSGYGILMEFLQPIIQPNDRCFSIYDIIANTSGAVCTGLITINYKK